MNLHCLIIQLKMYYTKFHLVNSVQFSQCICMCVCIPRKSSTPQTRHITFPPDIPLTSLLTLVSGGAPVRWRSSAGSTAAHSSFPTHSISLTLSETHICRFHVIYETRDKVPSRFKAFVSTSFSFSLLLPHLSATFQKPSVDQTYLHAEML